MTRVENNKRSPRRWFVLFLESEKVSRAVGFCSWKFPVTPRWSVFLAAMGVPLRWFTFETSVFWIIFGVIKFYVHCSRPLWPNNRTQRGIKCEMDARGHSSLHRRGSRRLTSFCLEIIAKRFLIRRKLDENVCQLEMCVRFNQPFHPHHGKCNFVSDRSRETGEATTRATASECGWRNFWEFLHFPFRLSWRSRSRQTETGALKAERRGTVVFTGAVCLGSDFVRIEESKSLGESERFRVESAFSKCRGSNPRIRGTLSFVATIIFFC